MKIIGLFLLLAGLWPLQAGILVNGNFADGRAHWKGDAQDIDPINMGGMSTQSPGVVIKLKPDKWSKIYQTFNNRAPVLYYTVSCKLSDDYALRDKGTSSPDFGDLPTDYMPWPLLENSWHIFVSGAGFFETTRMLKPDAHKTDTQTMTGRIADLKDVDEAVFTIFFPPGSGSITLLNVSLSPTDPAAGPGT